MLVKVTIKDRLAYVLLNRPEKKNALNGELVKQLLLAFDQIEEDPKVKVLVIKGAGEVFSAGADLAQLEKLRESSFEENLMDSQQLASLFKRIYLFPKVIIAQVEGAAIAGGCGLALVCDFVFAVPEARFGFPEVKIGFLPALVMVFAREKLGAGVTRKILLSGGLYPAEEALKWGMVYQIVDKGQIEAEVLAFAASLIEKNSGQSMAMTKKMLAALDGKTFEEALSFATEENARARGTKDFKQGLEAFLTKKKMNW